MSETEGERNGDDERETRRGVGREELKGALRELLEEIPACRNFVTPRSSENQDGEVVPENPVPEDQSGEASPSRPPGSGKYLAREREEARGGVKK